MTNLLLQAENKISSCKIFLAETSRDTSTIFFNDFYIDQDTVQD